jgi:replicative DNA helicase
MFAPSQTPDFRPPSDLPLINLEMEEVVLGGCMLDPNAITRIADFITPDAFYVSAHKDIYQAILALYKQNKPTDLLSVINWLADHDLLTRAGGRNKLSNLVNCTVSAVNIDYHVDTLIDKHIRRQLISRANKIERFAYETDKPLTWVLENTENLILPITQMRKQDSSKGYWHKWDQTVFERLCKDLEEVEEIENEAQRDWAFRKLYKKWKFSSKKELLDFHAKWLNSQDTAKDYTSHEYFQKYQSEQNWLIPGFVPADSVVVIYADGGAGKTRLTMSLAKAAVTGGTFAYEGTEFEAMNTLLIETDQGPRNTAKLIEMQGFLEDEAGSRLFICDDWSFGEFGRLKTLLKKRRPKLVILDSLTSLSINTLYSENDTEYARPLVRLRHFAKEFGCTFLVIHHSNSQGGIRGTRAIKNTVDEVFKFSKQQNELGEFNVLTIEKTRSRGPGSYKFTYDDDTWGWKFGGLIEEEFLGGSSGTTNMTRCIKFLHQNHGTPYRILEIAHALGLPPDSVRRDMRRAANEGLVNSGRCTYEKRALVYYVGQRKQPLNNPTTDHPQQSDQLLITLPIASVITSPLLQNKDSETSDQAITKNLPDCLAEENQNPRSLDHLITSSTPESPESFTSKDKAENNQLISKAINDVITSKKVDEDPITSRSHVTSLNKEIPIEASESVGKNEDTPKPQPLKIEVQGKLGTSTAVVSLVKRHKKYLKVAIDYTFADGTQVTSLAHPTNHQEAEKIATKEIERWHNEAMFKHSYRVMTLGEDEYIWVKGCKLVALPNEPVSSWYIFESPLGERLRVAGDDEFEVQVEEAI